MAKDSVSDQMSAILKQWSAHADEVIQKSAKKCAKECAEELRAKSPKGPEGYAQSWTSRKRGDGYVVYNKEHYRLTHLLENGHWSFNQYGGPYTFVPPQKHIKPVEQAGIVMFEDEIRKGLSK